MLRIWFHSHLGRRACRLLFYIILIFVSITTVSWLRTTTTYVSVTNIRSFEPYPSRPLCLPTSIPNRLDHWSRTSSNDVPIQQTRGVEGRRTSALGCERFSVKSGLESSWHPVSEHQLVYLNSVFESLALSLVKQLRKHDFLWRL